ncbi:hypothetical protein [Micromonospora sp. LOL_021]|uniref:hypothetical protein n=1 Tax=Micromonospora sp. LOL_021 TaxID=3345417 RepID=UPI003A8A7348
MYRRELLRTALAAGLTAAPLNHVADVLAAADRALSVGGPADLSRLEAATEQHSFGYGGRAPTDVLADLLTDFADVTQLLQRPQPATTRVALARITGQLGGMTAVVLHDLGNRREAYAWFGTATRAAAESGDRSLHAWVLARKAMFRSTSAHRRQRPNSPSRRAGPLARDRPPPRLWPQPSQAAPTPSLDAATKPTRHYATPTSSPTLCPNRSEPIPGSATASRSTTSTCPTP